MARSPVSLESPLAYENPSGASLIFISPNPKVYDQLFLTILGQQTAALSAHGYCPLIKSTLPTKFATNIFLGLEYISCGGATCCTSPLLIKTILSLIVIASI